MESGRLLRLLFIFCLFLVVACVCYYNKFHYEIILSFQSALASSGDEYERRRTTIDTNSVHVSYRDSSWARELFGTVWPRPVNETNHRMMEQIEFLDIYKLMNRTITRNVTKIILGVGKFNLESFKEGPELFQGDCPITQCVATRDLNLYSTADAVLISQYGRGSKPKPPKPRNQVWIAQHWESPKHNRIDVNAVKDLINWTASFRRESTIGVGYAHFEKIPYNTSTSNVTNYAKGKTKHAAMLASNCGPSNNRMGVARELGKHIPVDIYGRCGTFKCPAGLPAGSVACVKWMSGQYKFYLAFENSNCKDYITEKFFHNALLNDILPVVYGASRADYAAVAPPHSYIHVDDFTSPQKLAEYLHVLDKNDTMYNEYFAWKGTMRHINQRYWCRLCMLLHLRDEIDYVHWYKDYAQWWNGACPSTSTSK